MGTLSQQRNLALIATMCLAEILGMAAYAGFVAQLPQLSRDWQIGAAQAGWISGIYYAGYAIAVPSFLLLTDRFDPFRIYLGAMALSASGAVGMGMVVTGPWSAGAMQVVMGIGLAGTYRPGLRLMSDRLDGQVRSRAVAFYTGSYAVGTSASFLLVGVLSRHVGWRMTFVWAAAGPALAFLLVAMRVTPDGVARAKTSAGRIWSGLNDRQLLARSVAYAAHNFELFGFWSWVVAYFAFSNALHGQAHRWISPPMLAACVTLALLPASVFGNEVANRIGTGRWIVASMTASALIATTTALTGLSLPPILLAGLLILYGLVAASESGALTALVVAGSRPEERGARMAIYSCIGFAGAFSGPLAFGAALSWGGSDRSQGWSAGFGVLALGILVGPAALIAVKRRARARHG